MDGAEIQVETVERDLGVLMDAQLKFHEHAAAVVAKASQMLAIIKRSFATLERTAVPLLYKTMVRPLLQYGITIWGPFGKVDQKRLERVQRRATQMVGAIKHLPYEQRQRLRRLDLPSLYYRRRRGDMLTIHQLFHGDMALSPSKFLTRHTREQTRGHQRKLQKPRVQTLIRRTSLSSRIVNDWNSLPDSVVSATTANQFKARLDRLWINFKYDFPIP